MPRKVDKLLIMILLLVLSGLQGIGLRAQLFAPAADHIDTLGYRPGNDARDPLFVFYEPEGEQVNGRLEASWPGAGPYSFQWRRYDPSLPGFGPVFATEAAASSSQVTDLEEGAYQVRISDGAALDTSLTAWIMIDRLRDSVEQNPDGSLPSYLYTCDFVAVAGWVFPDTLAYYDLLTHEPISRVLEYRFKWTSDNPDLIIPNDTIVLRPNTTYKPPYEDTHYFLTAIDEFGMVETDSVFYESIQTKAGFSMEYYDKIRSRTQSEDVWDAGLTGNWEKEKGSLDAVLRVKFRNTSLNGARFEWVFLDTLGGIKQTEMTYDTATTTEFSYYEADEYYYPYLVSTSEEECIDTFQLEEPIFVVPSLLEIPNVFTPNGDGVNDFWVFKHQSLDDCRVTIVDRNGKIAYRKKIGDIYNWDGWDGNMHNSSRRAPEGQYYFVVEALGFDGEEYKDPNIIEKWRLNRGNTNNTSGAGSTPGTTEQEGPETLYTGWLYLYRHQGGF